MNALSQPISAPDMGILGMQTFNGSSLAAPAASGSTQSGGQRTRLTTTGNAAVLDVGLAGGTGAWIQSCDSSNLAVNYPLLLNPNGGNVGVNTVAPTSPLHVAGLAVHANNAAALGAGLTAGAFYRTGSDPDQVCVVH